MRLPRYLLSSAIVPLWASVFIAATIIFAAGCGSGRPKAYEVTGIVTYRGKPVQGAHVTFIPRGSRPATGETDAQGRFALLSFAPGDGAVAGEHVVCVAKSVPDAQLAPNSPYPRFISLLPKRYATPTQSPLKATVAAAGPNAFCFELTD
jgi:hypothetical protein